MSDNELSKVTVWGKTIDVERLTKNAVRALARMDSGTDSTDLYTETDWVSLRFFYSKQQHGQPLIRFIVLASDNDLRMIVGYYPITHKAFEKDFSEFSKIFQALRKTATEIMHQQSDPRFWIQTESSTRALRSAMGILGCCADNRTEKLSSREAELLSEFLVHSRPAAIEDSVTKQQKRTEDGAFVFKYNLKKTGPFTKGSGIFRKLLH